MNTRLLVIGVICTLFLAGIVARLGYVQITRHEDFEKIAASQASPSAFAESSLENRGKIFARSGIARDSFLFAGIRREYDLAINPQALADPEGAFSMLSPLVAFDRDDFFAKAQKKSDPFEMVKKQLTDEEVEAVALQLRGEKSGALQGVLLAPEKKRFYPAGPLASHVIGFIGADDVSTHLKGRYGIEQYFEAELARGADITLAIDPSVALFVEEILDIVWERWRPAAAGILVMEPRTGRILAMNAKPGFDPNRFYDANLSDFLNPFIQARIEPGSVIKPLTLAAALDAGVITPETTYYDKGFREFDTERINNFDKKGRGTVTMQDVLSHSINTGAVFAAEQLGKEQFRDYFIRFGLEEKTGVTLAGEIAGDIRNLESPRMIEFATASFGQGIAATPLALARAFAALANDGWLMKPLVVDGEPQRVRQVINESTARTITRMLVEVVDTKLAEGKGKIPGYSVAAKTGTAQLPDVTSGGYTEDFLHTFFGYAPAYDPRFLVFLFLEKPQGVLYASHTLTEPFRDLMQFLLATYAIHPDRVE